MVLDTDEMLERFAEKGAVLMRADITDFNPPAQALLEEVGGKAIPYLAVFCGDKPNEPRVLEGTIPSKFREELLRVLNECPAPKEESAASRPVALRSDGVSRSGDL